MCTSLMPSTGNYAEMAWVMNGRIYAIRLFSDTEVSFFNGDAWTEKHGRWNVNRHTGQVTAWFHYLGRGKRMAAVGIDMLARQEFVGYDYMERAITMRPKHAVFNGHRITVPRDVCDMVLHGCAQTFAPLFVERADRLP